MNCATCRAGMSEALDGRLDVTAGEAFLRHLQSCSACTTEFHELRISTKRLRSALPEPPPPGLAEEIIAQCQQADMVPEGEDGRVTARVWSRLTPAAALLIVAGLVVACGLAAYGGFLASWHSHASTIADERAADRLEIEKLAGTVRELEESAATRGSALATELANVKLELSAAVENVSSELLAERRLRQEERGRLGQVEQRLARREREVEDLRRLLDGAREAQSAMNVELGVLTEELDRWRTRAARGSWTVAAATTAAEPLESSETAASVRFRRRGARLEVVASGSLDELVPELLRWARRTDDREIAEVALRHVEDLLAMRIPEYRARTLETRPPDQDRATPLGGGEFVERLARNMTFTSMDIEEPGKTPESDRTSREFMRRLARAESTWREYDSSSRPPVK